MQSINHRQDWKNLIRKYKELFAGLGIFWILMIVMLTISLILNHGHIIYALDDAYIHMAIAKNFSQHGIWGVTKKEFSSSSSSLLYSLLLSLIFLFGPNELVPLIINLIFANILLFEVNYILKERFNIPSYSTFICLVSIILFIPLPFLVFTGMEHVIQIVINILFVYIASTILSHPNIEERKLFSIRKGEFLLSKQDKIFLIITPLVSMIRFEGMFLIIVVSALFFFRKKYFYSIMIAGLGLFPIIIYGLISMSYGWNFLPNSVILKGNSPNFTTIKGILDFFDIKIFIKNPHLIILLIVAIAIISIQHYKKMKIWNNQSIFSIIFIFVSLLHLLFIGGFIENMNFSRYDGYLIALGVLLLFISIKDFIPQELSVNYLKIYISNIRSNSRSYKIQITTFFVLIFFIFWINIPRSNYLLTRTPQASNNIYEQQYHMGLFLKKYYDGECVALNDIGAVSYLTDIEILDLRGLGSDEIAKSILNDELDEEVVYKAAKQSDCKIAVIYEDKDYGYKIPSEWTKVGEWAVRYDVVLGDDTISFWAINPDEINDLVHNLRDFSPNLPDTVKESGNYTR